MKYIIDSNIFIYAAAGVKEAVSALDKADAGERNGYSGITRLEVLGYSRFADEEENKLLAMLACFNEYDVSRYVINEAVKLRKISSIKVPDAIIAATARIHNATLLTRNCEDFKDIPDLDMFDPFA